jgi:uncharacterized protein
MFGELNSDEIESLVREELIARIAYVDRRGLPNIAPIAYAYDGTAFYGYSLVGAKLENMGANHVVCLEVERVHNAADWRTVIVHGTFETLHGAAAMDAVARISERMQTVAKAIGAPAAAAQTYVRRKGGEGVAYRIRVNDKRGRYATPDEG